MQHSQIFQGGEATQGSVGPPSVVVVQVGIEFLLKLGNLRRQGSGVELIPKGALHSLHVTIELGTPGWQHEELQAQALAGLFKLGHELTAPIHLHRTDRKGRVGDEVSQEAGRQIGRGFGMDFREGETGEEVDGREVLDRLPRAQGHGQGVYLDKVAGVVDFVSLGLPLGVGALGLPLYLSPPGPGQKGGYALDAAVGFQVGQDAAYGAFAYLAALSLTLTLKALLPQGQPDGPPAPGGVLLS